MADLIDRQGAVNEIIKYVKNKESNGDLTGFVGFTPKGIIEFLKRLPSAQPEQCEFCKNRRLEDGDTLYISADWDGVIGFDFIRDIHYCPKCGRRLNG